MTWQIVKIIAIISMTVDHAAATFLSQPFLIHQPGMSMTASYLTLEIMRAIGRIAFPLYAFGMAQGCAYTKNRKKFLLRLLLFAVLAEAPFQLAFRGSLSFGHLPITNVLFTLLIGSLCCFILDFFRKRRKAWAAILPIGALVLLAEICRTDYGGLGVLFVLLPYLFQKKRWKLVALATWLYGLPAVASMLSGGAYFASVLNWLCALSAVGILALYNGQEGRHSKVSKYFFYAYYPFHLLLFYSLTQWIGPISIDWSTFENY